MRPHVLFIFEGPIGDRIGRVELSDHPPGSHTIDDLLSELEKRAGELTIFDGPVSAGVEIALCEDAL